MSSLRRTTLLAIAALALAPCAVQRAQAHGTSDTVVTDETIDAIWRIQRVEFTYNSRDVYYACDALQDKIGRILRAVGAHERLHIELRCVGRFTNHAHARVTLAVPAEATVENVIAATTFDSRTQLLARMRKVSLPTPEDIERFPARWQSVSLTRHRGLRLESGDCDLLLAMRKQVFPTMPVRISSEGLHCALGASTGVRPKLEVLALMPAAATSADYFSMQR
jgi:hypothetical protein